MRKAKHLWVCQCCLAAIESHEGSQVTRRHYMEFEDEQNCSCDWCLEDGFVVLYELI